MIWPFPWQNCTGWIFPKALVAVYRNSTENITLSNAFHKLNDNEPTALYRLYSIHRSIQCHSVLF
jgi:plasmid replication initiation protein